MHKILFLLSVPLICLLANSSMAVAPAVDQNLDDLDLVPAAIATQQGNDQVLKPLIRNVVVEGNKAVTTRSILEKLPFKKNDFFDKKKTSKAIRAIYSLGYFKNIQIVTEDIEPGVIDLIIIVTEKNRISGITYSGNTVLTKEKLNTALDSAQIKTLDLEELKNIEQQIKKAYQEKNYHHVQVTGELQPDDKNTFIAHFKIIEGAYSRVKIVNFKGNNNLSDRFLRTKMITREDWILGFMDRSGMYHPDALLRDKYVIEDTYQSNGFLAARVVDTLMNENEYGEIEVTFVINEGDLYTISTVNAVGNELLTEQQLLQYIPIWPGQLYSKDAIRKTMEQLRILWGSFGYIYADVQPSIRPNEKNKTVAITFNTDLGNQITVNHINIVGNQKTRDNVIRRELLFNEGELLTTYLMDESKRRVEMLGFFDQKDGVNWKVIKLDEETADLELVLKEVKTGRAQMKLGFGPGDSSDAASTTERFSVGLEIMDTNFRGSGILYNMSGTYSRQDRLLNLALANRWLFDRPLVGGANFYTRSTTYEDFNQTVNPPVEKTMGINGNLGFRIEKLWYTQFAVSGGYERIRYDQEIQQARNPVLQASINRSFQQGDLAWIGGMLSQDNRNHPVYPNDGYNWTFDTKCGIPHSEKSYGFAKVEFDGNWFTPLIQRYGLALRLHGFFGFIHVIDHYRIPYRDLYHIGGPATVRGFKYGQIGPTMQGSSLGATKAMTVTAELQFPITEDYNMRGVLFYEGGAGWDTPDAYDIPKGYLRNNNFDFRHAIGFGVRLTSPTPICFDWGFKLDPRKRKGESLSEIHISATQSF